MVTSPLFPWILLTLWKERNKCIFNGGCSPPTDFLTVAIRAAKEWDQMQAAVTSSPSRTPLTYETQEKTSVIIRLDAAWRKEDKKSGLGWTVQRASMIRHLKKPVWHVASPLMAKGLAVREALLYCRAHGLSPIRLESDSS